LSKKLRKKEISRYARYPNKIPTKRLRRRKRKYRLKVKKFKNRVSKRFMGRVESPESSNYFKASKRRDLSDQTRNDFLRGFLYSRRGSAFHKGW